MSIRPIEIYNVCDRCGKPFINFCVSCEKAHREELVEQLMEDSGMSIKRLIMELAEDVLDDGNFAALKLAIEMRSMKPATKTDITSGGMTLTVDKNAKERLAAKIASIVNPDTEE